MSSAAAPCMPWVKAVLRLQQDVKYLRDYTRSKDRPQHYYSGLQYVLTNLLCEWDDFERLCSEIATSDRNYKRVNDNLIDFYGDAVTEACLVLKSAGRTKLSYESFSHAAKSEQLASERARRIRGELQKLESYLADASKLDYSVLRYELLLCAGIPSRIRALEKSVVDWQQLADKYREIDAKAREVLSANGYVLPEELLRESIEKQLSPSGMD